MPAYNAEKTIAESIKTVMRQTYEHWELIIADDGSTDNTPTTVSKYIISEPRISVISASTNAGVASARNRAISQAKGEYIAFLDSDDLWHEEKLAKQLQFMMEKDAAISYTATAYMYEGARSSYVLPAAPKLTYEQLLKRNLMSCSSVMVLREKMLKFPSGFMHEDYAAWLMIVKKEILAHGLNEPLLIYRLTKTSKSAKRFRSAKMLFNAYRHVGFSVFASLFLTARYSLHSFSKRALRQIMPYHALDQTIE